MPLPQVKRTEAFDFIFRFPLVPIIMKSFQIRNRDSYYSAAAVARGDGKLAAAHDVEPLPELSRREPYMRRRSLFLPGEVSQAWRKSVLAN